MCTIYNLGSVANISSLWSSLLLCLIFAQIIELVKKNHQTAPPQLQPQPQPHKKTTTTRNYNRNTTSTTSPQATPPKQGLQNMTVLSFYGDRSNAPNFAKVALLSIAWTLVSRPSLSPLIEAFKTNTFYTV